MCFGNIPQKLEGFGLSVKEPCEGWGLKSFAKIKKNLTIYSLTKKKEKKKNTKPLGSADGRNVPEIPKSTTASIILKWKEFRKTRTFLRAPSDQTERSGKKVCVRDVTANQLRDIKGIRLNSFRYYRAWSAHSIICLLVLVVMNKTEPSKLWEDSVARQQMGPCSEYIFNLKLLWTLKFKYRD